MGWFGLIQRWVPWLGRKDWRREVVVVIWGVHSPDWMNALASSAPVWAEVPGVSAVLHFSSPEQRVPLTVRWGRRTVVIPLMENNIAERPLRYAALCPDPEALGTLGDKRRFAAYVEQRQLANWCPVNFASIEEATFPCVLKRTNLNGGLGVEVTASREQAQSLLSRDPFAGHPCVIQSLVPFDIEYVVHCVCVKGRILWHVAYANDAGYHPIRRAGQPRSLRRMEFSCEQLNELETFLSPLAYTGPCNFDCTRGSDGRLVVFEINPRLGGSLMRPDNTADLAACLSVIINEAT